MQGNLKRLTDAQKFISSCIGQIAESIITEQEGIYTLHIDQIAERLPRDFVIYELMNSRFAFKGDVIESLIRALDSGVGSGRRVYTRDYVAYIDRNDIVITKIEESDSCIVEVAEDATRAYCGNSALYIERIMIDLIDNFDLGDNVALIDADKLTYPLTLRRWCEGDSFIPLGMEGHKKVSDFLIDEKVSMPEKGRQFILMSGEDIVWLIGRRIDDRFKIDDESENILKITKEIL